MPRKIQKPNSGIPNYLEQQAESAHNSDKSYLQENQNVLFQEISAWTQQQVEIFLNQYLEHCSSWKYISMKIQTKSANAIKNKFNNSIRSASKILSSFQKNFLHRTRRSISKFLLLATLQIANKSQLVARNLGLSINWESKLFTFKFQILKFCLKPDEFSEKRIQNLVKLTNAINYKMRTLSIYKTSNFKNWRITQKIINFIYAFDKFTNQDVGKFIFNEQTKIFEIENDSKNKSQTNLHSIDDLIDLQNIKVQKKGNIMPDRWSQKSFILNGQQQWQNYLNF